MDYSASQIGLKGNDVNQLKFEQKFGLQKFWENYDLPAKACYPSNEKGGKITKKLTFKDQF